jgi:glycosyltransferase involved in cell wall biosynthesis
MNNLISVIIPTYNRSHYLREAIESVLNQVYESIEIIVIDDGSTDDTKGVVEKYGERIKYIYQDNAGVTAARNTGTENAKGKFVAFLDDDDIWEANMLQKAIKMLDKAGEEVGVAYVDCRYFRASDRKALFDKGMSQFSGDIFGELLKANFIPINTVLIKKECFDKVKGFDENIEWYEDWDLLLRIALAGYKFEFINEPLAHIRVHDTHRSSNLLMMKECALKVLEKLEKMPGKSSKQERLVKRTLAKRHLALGWYLTLHDRRDEGREEIRRAEPVSVTQAIQKMIAAVLAIIPNTKLLLKINTLIESVFGQRNPYQVK